jgi:uncharacterized coiled-coil DUF342 family protein
MIKYREDIGLYKEVLVEQRLCIEDIDNEIIYIEREIEHLQNRLQELQDIKKECLKIIKDGGVEIDL